MGGNVVLQITWFYFKNFVYATNFIKNLSELGSVPISNIHHYIGDYVSDHKDKTIGAERVLKPEDSIWKISTQFVKKHQHYFLRLYWNQRALRRFFNPNES